MYTGYVWYLPPGQRLWIRINQLYEVRDLTEADMEIREDIAFEPYKNCGLQFLSEGVDPNTNGTNTIMRV